MKQGDKVKLLVNLPAYGVKAGDIGTVRHRDNDPDGAGYVADFPGSASCGVWLGNDEIELIHHPAIPPKGMSSKDLADYVGDFIRAAQARVNGVGDEQYSIPEGQKFEGMTPNELIQMAREEAQDLAAYAAMMDIRLARMAEKLGGIN